MGNPLRAAARSVVLDARKQSDTDMSWDGDRGWQVVRGTYGSKNDPPQAFEYLVFEAFRKNPVVSSCIRTLTNSLTEAPIYPFRPLEGDKWERILRHRAEELFMYPNDRDGYVELVTQFVQHFFTAGNAFWRKLRLGSGRIDGLLPIRPDRVISAIVDENAIPLGWKIFRADDSGQWDIIPADDIVHFRDIDPLNEIFGMPRLLSSLLDVLNDNKASKYVNEVLDNHGSPGLLIGVEPTARPAQILDAEERWQEKFGPGRGRGKVGFVPGGRVVKEIGFTLTQLEFPNLRALSRESICTVFGIDPLLIGIGSAARKSALGGTEAIAALRRLWVQTLIPMIRAIESVLNYRVAPEFGENVYLFFETDEIEALQEARNDKVERAYKLKQTGVYTAPEIRAETGHSPAYEDDATVVRDAQTVNVPASLLEATILEDEHEEDRERANAFAEAEGRNVGESGREDTEEETPEEEEEET